MAAELLLAVNCVDGAPACALVLGRDCMAGVEAQVSAVGPSGHHLARHQGNVNEFRFSWQYFASEFERRVFALHLQHWHDLGQWGVLFYVAMAISESPRFQP